MYKAKDKKGKDQVDAAKKGKVGVIAATPENQIIT